MTEHCTAWITQNAARETKTALGAHGWWAPMADELEALTRDMYDIANEVSIALPLNPGEDE